MNRTTTTLLSLLPFSITFAKSSNDITYLILDGRYDATAPDVRFLFCTIIRFILLLKSDGDDDVVDDWAGDDTRFSIICFHDDDEDDAVVDFVS